LRAEKMITVPSGDNVVRLLPPLIVGEPEIAEAIARLDRACARLSGGGATAAAANGPARDGGKPEAAR
jgi:acetylornithine/N-succinyldiaminopimelate aminotransferase